MLTLFFLTYERRRKVYRHAVIGCLALRFEQSGSEICRETGLGPAQVYPVLSELERGKMIESRWVGDSYPRKRVYRLAQEDKQASSNL